MPLHDAAVFCWLYLAAGGFTAGKTEDTNGQNHNTDHSGIVYEQITELSPHPSRKISF